MVMVPQGTCAQRDTFWCLRRTLILASIFLFFVVFGCLSPASTENCAVQHQQDEITLDMGVDVMTLSHDPILIMSDSDFSSQGWPGSGLPGNPYYIEGQVISSSDPDEHGIEIQNTRAHFVINSCIISGINDVSAIVLSNVSNCVIKNNLITANDLIGIEILRSSNISIMKNNCSYGWRGIEINISSTNITINNNTIEKNTELGVYIGSSSINNTIYWNTFDLNFINAKDDGPSPNNFTFNFWSDYEGIDSNDDKYGDTEYEIDGFAQSIDPLPLMLPPDRLPVYWNDIPTDKTEEYGHGFSYQMNATIYGGFGHWWLNDSLFSIDDSGLINEADWLAVGSYGLEVGADNYYGDAITGTFSVLIEDTTDPVWSEALADQFVELGNDFYYDLNATDFSTPLVYSLTSSPNFTINAATGVITNSTALSLLKEYTIYIQVNDAQSNSLYDTLQITVQDTSPPEWLVLPTNRTIELNSIFQYDLDAFDLNGLDTWIIDNGLFQIDSQGVITNSSTLATGEYAIEVRVNDTVGNVLIDSFIVRVQDTTAPTWIMWPADHILEYGERLDIQLQARDAAGIAYWTISDTTHFDITTLGRIFSIGIFDQVTYIVTVTAFDPSGNFVSASFSITVQDTHAPVWSIPLEDVTFELGAQIRIPLRATDPSGVTGWSVEEDTQFSADINGVITNATYLSVGIYLIHVSVRDLLGYVLYGVFSVEIQDTTAPTWIYYPREVNVTAPEILDSTLLAFDLSGLDQWELNDTDNFLIDSEGHLVGRGILPAGSYGLAITVSDQYGNSETIEMTVNAFALDPSIMILGAGVWAAAMGLGILVILIFDPKRRRFGFFSEVA